MRSVNVDLYQILDMLGSLREEQGTTGWIIRRALADMLVTPPTEAEVRWFLDEQDRRNGRLTASEALVEYVDSESSIEEIESIEEIWCCVRHHEKPIAEFLTLWDASGNRQDQRAISHLTPHAWPTWHVTPEKYRG